MLGAGGREGSGKSWKSRRKNPRNVRWVLVNTREAEVPMLTLWTGIYGFR